MEKMVELSHPPVSKHRFVYSSIDFNAYIGCWRATKHEMHYKLIKCFVFYFERLIGNDHTKKIKTMDI